MRISNGIKHAKASQSSLNNFSVRIYRPVTRNIITVAAKEVHHQQTSNVGLLSENVRDGGAAEYIPIVAEKTATLVYLHRGTSEELRGFASAVSATAINYGSLIVECLLLSWEVRRIALEV